MISFFPDLNVWVALSVDGHSHGKDAWNWLGGMPHGSRLLFSRYTQVGLLRLLTNESAMGERTLTLDRAWNVYDQWLGDPRVEFQAEPRSIEEAFRAVTEPFGEQPASRRVGDCYLLAYAREVHATLATFDAALLRLAHKQQCRAVFPA